MKILIITNIFPSRRHPDSGTYVADQVSSIKSFAAVRVISKSAKSRTGFVSFALKTMMALLLDEYDVIHAHYGFHSALLPLLLRRKPLVVTFLGSDALIEPDRNLLYRFLQKRLVAYADRLVAVSRQIESRLVNDLGADAGKVSVIPCGVDTAKFQPRQKAAARKMLGLKDGAKIALFIGRLTHAKGVDLIDHASRRLPEVDFYLIGEGPLRWQSANCFFTGVVEHEKMPAWLNAADVLLLPSRSEGTPVAVLEALASETPVICSTVGACPELVTEGKTGMLVPVGDAQSLVEAIERAFSGMRFDAACGRRLIVQNFDLEVISAKLRALYSHLVLERLSRL